MKKLLTLVLALVMVFAVAAPAMALTDEALGTVANTNDAYSLEVALYQANVADYAAGATFVLPAVQGANRAYVANENVYFGIKLYQKENVEAANKVPQMMKITSTYSSESKIAKQIQVDTNGKVVEQVAAATDIKGNSDGVTQQLYGIYTVEKTAATVSALNQKGETLYIFGTFVNGSKDFSVKVEIKPAFALSTSTVLDLGDDLNVIEPEDGFYIVNNTKDSVAIAFITDGVGRVKEMRYATSVQLATNTFKITDDGVKSLEYDETYKDNTDGLVTAWNIGNVKVNATEQGLIDKVFNKLGFDIAKQNTNAVKDKHFIAKLFGVHLEAEVNGAYYTAVVTIPDVTVVEPPKTGDASTVAGFVMIAAAIVATLGLAYNKVRA